jgi:tetratricopeptide (TPR) repeat protein
MNINNGKLFFRIIVYSLLMIIYLNTANATNLKREEMQPYIPLSLVKELNNARDLRENGQFDAAKTVLGEILKLQPNYYNARINIGLVSYDLNEFGEAIKHLLIAVEIKNSEKIIDPHFYNLVGWVYMETGKFKEAEIYLKQAVENEGVNSPSVNRALFNNIGLLYMYQNKLNLAEYFFKIAFDRYENAAAEKNLKLIYEARELDYQKSKIPGSLTMLRSHIKWSLFHEGAIVWKNNALLTDDSLKEVLLSKQIEGKVGYISISNGDDLLIEKITDNILDETRQKYESTLEEIIDKNLCKKNNIEHELLTDFKNNNFSNTRELILMKLNLEKSEKYVLNAYSNKYFKELIYTRCKIAASH